MPSHLLRALGVLARLVAPGLIWTLAWHQGDMVAGEETPPALLPMDIDASIMGDYVAGSATGDSHDRGGFAHSSAWPVAAPSEFLSGHALYIRVDPTVDVPFWGCCRGMRIWVVNAGSTEVELEALDVHLDLVQEAVQPLHGWTPIEHHQHTNCCNSHHHLVLRSGEMWPLIAPRYQGALETVGRFALTLKGSVLYSQQFPLSVNPGQFTREARYDTYPAALGLIGTPALPRLCALLSSHAEAAVEGLGMMGPQAFAAVDALRRELRHPHADRRVVLITIGRIGPGAVDAVHDLLQVWMEDALDRPLIAGVVHSLGESVVPVLLVGLDDPQECAGAASALALFGSQVRSVAPRLLHRFEVGCFSAVGEVAVAEALMRIASRYDRCIPVFRHRVQDPDPALRIQVARALGYADAELPTVLDLLGTSLNDPDPRVVEVAIESFTRLGPAALPALSQLEEFPLGHDAASWRIKECLKTACAALLGTGRD